MSEHFVKHINIEKYKCFSDFSAEGFKRVNLISGKNNVGKTALMEALMLSARSESVAKFFKGLRAFFLQRHRQDYSGMAFDEEAVKQNVINQAGFVSIVSNQHAVSFSYDDSGFSRSYGVEVDDKALAVLAGEDELGFLTKNNTSTEDQIGIFIGSLGISQRLMIDFFTSIQKKDKESEVYEYIQGLDSTIENVKIIGGNSIQCKVREGDGKSSYRDLNEFGDGLRHFLAIVVALFRAENSYVCIDELGSGVHYSSLDQLWEIILTLSKELNVQVFATTHSRECVESYCRVAEKLKEQDISFITLVRNKEKEVKAIVRDYEVFTDSIHDNREVRGW